MNIHIFGHLYFITIIVVVFSDKCIQNSPCSCEYDDEKTINLKPLSSGNFLNVTDGQLTYFFHPCSDRILKFLPNNVTSECAKNAASLCLYNGSNVTILGVVSEVKIEISAKPGLYDIVYNHGNKVTHITLVCTADFGTSVLYANKTTDANKHKLVLFSSVACEHYEHKGLSTGSVLVVLFLLLLVVYFLGGALVLHFLRGARGREMIPNIDFWTDLPLLIKDGVVFLQNGCKPTISNSDSYDRI